MVKVNGKNYQVDTRLEHVTFAQHIPEVDALTEPLLENSSKFTIQNRFFIHCNNNLMLALFLPDHFIYVSLVVTNILNVDLLKIR